MQLLLYLYDDENSFFGYDLAARGVISPLFWNDDLIFEEALVTQLLNCLQNIFL